MRGGAPAIRMVLRPEFRLYLCCLLFPLIRQSDCVEWQRSGRVPHGLEPSYGNDWPAGHISTGTVNPGETIYGHSVPFLKY